eukprot:5330908-Pyramimonas_sp.AAC.1
MPRAPWTNIHLRMTTHYRPPPLARRGRPRRPRASNCGAARGCSGAGAASRGAGASRAACGPGRPQRAQRQRRSRW